MRELGWINVYARKIRDQIIIQALQQQHFIMSIFFPSFFLSLSPPFPSVSPIHYNTTSELPLGSTTACSSPFPPPSFSSSPSPSPCFLSATASRTAVKIMTRNSSTVNGILTTCFSPTPPAPPAPPSGDDDEDDSSCESSVGSINDDDNGCCNGGTAVPVPVPVAARGGLKPNDALPPSGVGVHTRRVLCCEYCFCCCWEEPCKRGRWYCGAGGGSGCWGGITGALVGGSGAVAVAALWRGLREGWVRARVKGERLVKDW